MFQNKEKVMISFEMKLLGFFVVVVLLLLLFQRALQSFPHNMSFKVSCMREA